MSNWKPYGATIYDIMSQVDIESKLSNARRLLRGGIDPNHEWSYYYDCFMWSVRHAREKSEFEENYGYTDLGDFFGICNAKTYLKMQGKFQEHYTFDPTDTSFDLMGNSRFEGLWAMLSERCKDTNRQPITGNDGAVIKDLMAKPWEWHIQFLFEYLGYDLEPKEEESPFVPGMKVKIASPRENAALFNIDFSTTERHLNMRTVTIGKNEFSTILIWLSLKLMGASDATKRSFGVYTFTFDNGSKQSYLKIMADSNECYICSF